MRHAFIVIVCMLELRECRDARFVDNVVTDQNPVDVPLDAQTALIFKQQQLRHH